MGRNGALSAPRPSCTATAAPHTYLGRAARLAVPILVRDIVEFERRFEAREVEGAETASVAAEEVALAVTRVAEVVVGLDGPTRRVSERHYT